MIGELVAHPDADADTDRPRPPATAAAAFALAAETAASRLAPLPGEPGTGEPPAVADGTAAACATESGPSFGDSRCSCACSCWMSPAVSSGERGELGRAGEPGWLMRIETDAIAELESVIPRGWLMCIDVAVIIMTLEPCPAVAASAAADAADADAAAAVGGSSSGEASLLPLALALPEAEPSSIGTAIIGG